MDPEISFGPGAKVIKTNKRIGKRSKLREEFKSGKLDKCGAGKHYRRSYKTKNDKVVEGTCVRNPSRGYTVKELRQSLKNYGLKGYSKLKKAALIQLYENREF